MARCKECEDFEICIKLGEEHWEDYPYPDAINNVEERCGGFKLKTEREKDMVSCKDCANGEVCGDVMEEAAEKCEVYANKLAEAAKPKKAKLSVEYPIEGKWGKATEAEETTLKIKAAGYDTIKTIVEEHMKEDYPFEETFAQIDGVMRMEEAVMKTLI